MALIDSGLQLLCGRKSGQGTASKASPGPWGKVKSEEGGRHLVRQQGHHGKMVQFEGRPASGETCREVTHTVGKKGSHRKGKK